MTRFEQATPSHRAFTDIVRRAVFGVVCACLVLFATDLAEQRRIISPLTDAVIALVLLIFISWLLVYLSHRAPVSAEVRRVLLVPVTCLIVAAILSVTNKIEFLDDVALIGHASTVQQLFRS